MKAVHAAVIFSRLESAGFESLEIRCDRDQYEVTQEELPTICGIDYRVIALFPLTRSQLIHLADVGLAGYASSDGYEIRRYPE